MSTESTTGASSLRSVSVDDTLKNLLQLPRAAEARDIIKDLPDPIKNDLFVQLLGKYRTTKSNEERLETLFSGMRSADRDVVLSGGHRLVADEYEGGDAFKTARAFRAIWQYGNPPEISGRGRACASFHEGEFTDEKPQLVQSALGWGRANESLPIRVFKHSDPWEGSLPQCLDSIISSQLLFNRLCTTFGPLPEMTMKLEDYKVVWETTLVLTDK